MSTPEGAEIIDFSDFDAGLKNIVERLRRGELTVVVFPNLEQAMLVCHHFRPGIARILTDKTGRIFQHEGFPGFAAVFSTEWNDVAERRGE